MPKKVVLKIEPPLGSLELDAVSAFKEILDAIELAKETIPSNVRNNIIWELEKASKNSPFHVEMTAESVKPNGIPENMLFRFSETLDFFIDDKDATKPEWVTQSILSKAKRFFEPNLDKIRSDVLLPEIDKRFHITPPIAKRAIDRIEQLSKKEPTWPVELGSVEGEIKEIGKYRGNPSFTLADRRDNHEIRCMVDKSLADKIGEMHTWAEAWKHKRIIVSGKIIRDQSGAVTHIKVRSVRDMPAPPEKIEDILDKHFTNGLTPEAYLKKIRGEK